MTEDEIVRIEQGLGISLPCDYRNILKEYPFSEDSFIAESHMFHDMSILIEINAGRHQSLSSKYFQIGNDGSEARFYIDVESENSAVYEWDIESGTLSQKATDINDWLEQCRAIQDEVLLDEQLYDTPLHTDTSRQPKAWWKFWK